MCGRYVIIKGKIYFAVSAQLATWRNQGVEFDILPKYNARPTDRMPVLAQRKGTIGVELMRWNLIPHWSIEGKSEFSTFNAKAETLANSKLFAPYFKGSRCLVPADGFYEWKKYTVETKVRGKKKQVEQKQKMFICMKDRSSFMMAGLFSVWKNSTGEEFPTFTIITTSANKLIASIHDRMPVILDPKDHEVWLNREVNDTNLLQSLLVSYPEEMMSMYPVANRSEESHEMIEKIEVEFPGTKALMEISDQFFSKKPKKK